MLVCCSYNHFTNIPFSVSLPFHISTLLRYVWDFSPLVNLSLHLFQYFKSPWKYFFYVTQMLFLWQAPCCEWTGTVGQAHTCIVFWESNSRICLSARFSLRTNTKCLCWNQHPITTTTNEHTHTCTGDPFTHMHTNLDTQARRHTIYFCMHYLHCRALSLKCSLFLMFILDILRSHSGRQPIQPGNPLWVKKDVRYCKSNVWCQVKNEMV